MEEMTFFFIKIFIHKIFFRKNIFTCVIVDHRLPVLVQIICFRKQQFYIVDIYFEYDDKLKNLTVSIASHISITILNWLLI